MINRDYLETVRLMLRVMPLVFSSGVFAMKGGTAINLFLADMPRLSVDIDVVFLPLGLTRDEALGPARDIRGKDHGRIRSATPSRPFRYLASIPRGWAHKLDARGLPCLSRRS